LLFSAVVANVNKQADIFQSSLHFRLKEGAKFYVQSPTKKEKLIINFRY